MSSFPGVNSAAGSPEGGAGAFIAGSAPRGPHGCSIACPVCAHPAPTVWRAPSAAKRRVAAELICDGVRPPAVWCGEGDQPPNARACWRFCGTAASSRSRRLPGHARGACPNHRSRFTAAFLDDGAPWPARSAPTMERVTRCWSGRWALAGGRGHLVLPAAGARARAGPATVRWRSMQWPTCYRCSTRNSLRSCRPMWAEASWLPAFRGLSLSHESGNVVGHPTRRRETRLAAWLGPRGRRGSRHRRCSESPPQTARTAELQLGLMRLCLVCRAAGEYKAKTLLHSWRPLADHPAPSGGGSP